jgi:hypothetical protein
MGEMRNIYRILIGESEGRGHLVGLDIDGTITLNWIFKKLDWSIPTGFIWLVFEKKVMNLRPS